MIYWTVKSPLGHFQIYNMIDIIYQILLADFDEKFFTISQN